jgi:hypothetical protein
LNEAKKLTEASNLYRQCTTNWWITLNQHPKLWVRNEFANQPCARTRIQYLISRNAGNKSDNLMDDKIEERCYVVATYNSPTKSASKCAFNLSLSFSSFVPDTPSSE